MKVLDEMYFFMDMIEKDIVELADNEDYEEALDLKTILDSLKSKEELF